nr:uncharacterized protein LOC115257038 [Aedes albopictus]
MSLASSPSSKDCVFLPHHCVVKESSSTTKCRVVFDGSSKTSNGKSLNDILMMGPILQDSLINILLRFRFPAVVITGDIQQMYRMIQLSEDDRDYQRILWWSTTEPVEEYRLNTVTYDCFPTTVEKAIKGTYIDDVITGADSGEEAKELRIQLSEIFASGGFHLRKWASNSTAALAGVPEEDIEVKAAIELDGSTTIKTIRIHWQPCSDEFKFAYHQPQISQSTKRIILSQIASLYDPLGLLAPTIVMAKLVMQKLWELRVDWDANPPGELTNHWLSLVQHLSVLNHFQVPRRVIGVCKPLRTYLHGYSDASERAMGACVYVRTVDDAVNISSRLLCSKSKIAPIGNNRTTLPRLELCASVLLARLISNVKSTIN